MIESYKPPKPPLRLKSVPRYGQVYWCDFSISNILPEFDDVHPVIIIRSGQKLANPHLVVPLTSRDHEGDVYAYRLPVNPHPQRPGGASWVVCNHIYTVASERLWPLQNRFKNDVFPLIPAPDMQRVARLVRKALHRLITDSLYGEGETG
ncbi:MAG: type II toxin-antitoxin system PemK/MazF family toxin [Asticcacaulis sp.]|uniref:type II toxin-antitoxin system PemK/MazF family toxin n=1 Tax=Asticcacaulis sp. TaxID=1872648 RepID=UPI003F7CC6FB